MKLRMLMTVLLSAALIWSIQQETPVHKSFADKASTKKVIVASKTSTAQKNTQTQPEIPDPSLAPAVVAAPVIQVPQGCAAYMPLLQQYDWDINVMAAVMQAESNCNPNAESPPNYDGLRDYGLMQLHGQEIFDPATNVAHAYTIWQRQGYHAWSTYNSGAYLKYL